MSQQDGLHRVLGAAGTLELGGRHFRLAPPTLAMRAALSQHLAQQRRNPIEVVGQILGKVDPALHQALIAEAVRQAAAARTVTDEELEEYLNSWAGTVHLFLLMAQPQHPELTLDEAQRLLDEYADGRLLELWGKLDAATGVLSDMAALGNSEGQNQTAEPEAAA